jgi:hypothetical protein
LHYNLPLLDCSVIAIRRVVQGRGRQNFCNDNVVATIDFWHYVF